MTPPKAERPLEQSGSCYDRPLSTPETSSLEYGHHVRAELLDPDAATTFESLWTDENTFLAQLQEQVSARKVS